MDSARRRTTPSQANLQATKKAQPSAPQNKCQDQLLSLIQKAADRQIKNMDPLRLEVDNEKINFAAFGQVQMQQDVANLVQIADAAVTLAQNQEESCKRKYQKLCKHHEEIKTLEQQCVRIKARLEDLSDDKILKNKNQINAVINMLKGIKEASTPSAMLQKVDEAQESAKKHSEQYGTYASAFAKIPKAAPRATWLNIRTVFGFTTQVQSCLPCTAKAFVASFLQQHRTNPAIATNISTSHAIRLLGAGAVLLEFVGVEQVYNPHIYIIFVATAEHTELTDVVIDTKAAEKSEKSQDSAETNQCNTDLAECIILECNSQMKSLEQLVNTNTIEQTREELDECLRKLETHNIATRQWNKESDEKELTRCKQQMDDMNIRTQRFLRQQHEAKEKLTLYQLPNAADLMDEKFERLDYMFQTLTQISVLAKTGELAKTLAYIKEIAPETGSEDTLWQQVHGQIPTEIVGAVNVNVRVWTPKGIKTCFPSLCVPCGVEDLINALKEQNAQDAPFVHFLETMTARLIIEGKVASAVPKGISLVNSIDVVLYKTVEGK